MQKIPCILIVAILISACTQQNVPKKVDSGVKNTLTQGAVQMTVKVGQTTKTDVIENLGPPNITSLDGDGHEEKWPPKTGQ